MVQIDAIEIYTVTFLSYGDRYLLLQRSPNKAFAPMRWTGLGGHVERDELSCLRASALREVWEESGIVEKDIQDFHFRRVLLTNRPGPTLGIVLYFTGVLQQYSLPECPEGQLFWKSPDEFKTLDIIETTRPVLACLIEDMHKDPHGFHPLITGLGVFDSHGLFKGVTWGD
jgi:8-oxo-dGTP diphosphatase